MPETKQTIEKFWICLDCGCEHHGLPDFAELTKCQKCGKTNLRKRNRSIMPIKQWKRN